MISDRVKNIELSKTLAVDAIAKARKKEGIDVVGFGAGEPDFETPHYIRDAGIEALNKGFTKYVPTLGIPELRSIISDKLKNENKADYSPDEIIVSAGAKQIIYEAILATINPKDKVLIPDPWWVSYVPIVKMAQGIPVFLPTTEENEFKLIPETIEEKITDKTKLIIINSPNNPTGSMLDRSDLQKIANICIDFDIIALSDEIYEKLVYDGNEHVSIASFDGMKERTITVNGFSKAYAMTGWRLGYAGAPLQVIKGMDKIQAHSVSSATSIVQYAGVTALKQKSDELAKMVSEFKKRRDFLVKRVNEIKGLHCVKPKGAFYAFVNISEHLDEVTQNSAEFSEWLLEKGLVAAVPGSAFGECGEGFMRLSYATSMENISKGLDRIEAALKNKTLTPPVLGNRYSYFLNNLS